MLTTKRLMIRPPKAEDVEDYLEFRNSNFVLRYNAMRPLSREDAEKEIIALKRGCSLSKYTRMISRRMTMHLSLNYWIFWLLKKSQGINCPKMRSGKESKIGP